VGKRRKAREIVLQSMYASMISGAKLDDTLDDQLSRRESADDTNTFAKALAEKVKSHAGELDYWMNTLISEKWDPSRLGSLEVVILTIALAELKHSPDVPYRVVINEALELTHRYCDENAVGFINGVLDRAAYQVYGNEEQEDN
jgi:transcription antitermination protein NusB